MHEWRCSTGNIMRTIRLQEAEGARREELRVTREEIEAAHNKEETKYRSAGRKVRTEKAAIRFAEMENLLQSQALEHMQMEETQTRTTSHVDSKYERTIDHVENSHKLLHDPRFGHAKPIGRILMVKLRRLKQDPKGLLKELAANGHDAGVTEMILRIAEAQLLAAPTDRLALKFVAENFCGSLTSVMKIEEWRDNIFLQSVIVSMINVLGSRCAESRSSFNYYPFVYLTSMLDTFPTDPVLLTSALTSMFILCSQCPLQRKHGFDAGAVAKVVEVVNSRRRDWRVVNAGVKALTGLCCRCGSNKNVDEEEAVVVPLVLDILQEYSQDNCLESADVCGVVSRSCFLLIKSLTSKDDDGLTETFSYEQYLEEGGERIEVDLEQDAADDKAKKEKFFAKKEASRKGLDIVDSEDDEVALTPGEIKMTQIMKAGGVGVMLDCARYHINDPRTALFFVQCLHSILYNLLPLIETVEAGGKDTYPEIVDLMLTFMVNFRYNPVIIWSCLTNLTFVCNSDLKGISCIESWGRVSDGNPDDEESVDEYAEVSIDDGSISGDKVDGCKLLAKGLKDFKNNIDLAEQYCRLILCMSCELDGRMGLLRAGCFDILETCKKAIEEEKGGVLPGGFAKLCMNAQLALETGQRF
ncbi:hypothetical protein TL16_g05936 [Triparma laevis f. inornata]|uniref:Uncharacterized protein n=1 Tax=Triparma laevis f. inornata TaxID=1714386 RepID=A0A9W7EDL6_9STRA|nr:hypothetical protein TL16_g05936 [Triparma laevis f. inornata]